MAASLKASHTHTPQKSCDEGSRTLGIEIMLHVSMCSQIHDESQGIKRAANSAAIRKGDADEAHEVLEIQCKDFRVVHVVEMEGGPKAIQVLLDQMLDLQQKAICESPSGIWTILLSPVTPRGKIGSPHCKIGSLNRALK